MIFFILLVIIFTFKIIISKDSNICEPIPNSYVVFKYFENDKIELNCSTIAEQKDEKITTDGVLMSSDLNSEIALYTEHDAILIDKKSNEKKVLNPKIDDGIIQSAGLVNGETAFAVNTGTSGNEYISYISIGEQKIDSQGGLITSFIERDGNIYVLERKVPSTERILYKYNSAYELIKEIDVTGYVADKIGLSNEGNIILYNENYILNLDQYDVISKFEHDIEEQIADLMIRENEFIVITNFFNIYKIDIDGKNKQLIYGEDEFKKYSETYITGCYLTYSKEKTVCEVTFLEGGFYNIMHVIYDFDNDNYEEHYIFNFNTKDKKGPSKLILINE